MSNTGQIIVTEDAKEAALKRLDELEAAEAAEAAGNDPAPTDPDDATEAPSVTDGEQQHAAAPENSEQTTTETDSDTPATTDEQPDPLDALLSKGDEPQAPQKPKDGKEPSRFEKAQKRAAEEWKRINEDKETIKTEREAIRREREAFQREVDAYERRRTPTPEQMESNAAAMEQQLDLLEAKAIKAERKAETSEDPADEQAAQAAREQFNAAREERIGFIRAWRKEADRLRKNPDPAAVDRETRFKKEQGKWWTQAVEQFPQVGVKGSPLNDAARKVMSEDAEFAEHPKGIYLAARIAAAETAAARVPELEKAVETLKAKLAEAEVALSPGNEGIPHTNLGERSFAEKSEAEQEAELRQMARQIG